MPQLFHSYGGKTCLSPLGLDEDALEIAGDRATSFRLPLGYDPGVGYVLMTKEDVDDLSKGGFIEFKWVDSGSKTTFTFDTVYNTATSLFPRRSGDKNTPYLVEFCDKRKLFKMGGIEKYYNIRMPAPASEAGTGVEMYHTESLNSGSVWTWQTAFDDLWALLPSGASPGTAPTLPYTPEWNFPENMTFIGESPWEAIEKLLERIECTIALSAAGVFTAVRLGTTQAGLLSEFNRLFQDLRLADEYEPVVNTYSYIPETFRVFFPIREIHTGAEKTSPRGSNWQIDRYHTKDVSSGVSDVVTGTVKTIFNDLEALRDESGTITNSATLDDVAAEVAQNYADRLENSDDQMGKVFAGIITTISPGSQVKEVIWSDTGDGPTTEVLRYQIEKPKDPKTPTTPGAYPRDVELVQVHSGNGGTGNRVSANDSGYHPGRVVRYAQGMTVLDDCWILFIDDFDDSSGAIEADEGEYYGPAKLCGIDTVSDDTRPVYATKRTGHIKECGTGTGTGTGTGNFTSTKRLCLKTQSHQFHMIFPEEICIQTFDASDPTRGQGCGQVIDLCDCGTGTGGGVGGGGTGQESTCCSGTNIPSEISFSIDSDCNDLDGDTGTLTWNPANSTWAGTTDVGGDTLSINLECCGVTPQDWVMYIGDSCEEGAGASNGALSGQMASCDPLSLVFDFTLGTDTCGSCTASDSLTITVTE